MVTMNIKSYQYVELLPPLGKVDLPIQKVRVAYLDEGEVLQHQPYVGDAGGAGLAQGKSSTQENIN